MTDRDSFEVPGLQEPVEIRIDQWGVPHLYAASQDDLFLAQGFNAARDRLFQLDLWRRRGLGLLAEVLGERYAEHDRAARLFLYRGDMAEEWRAYGDDTERVTTAFVNGINAYVSLCRADATQLPPEFALLAYEPAYWQPSDVARVRSHGLQYNLRDEVARALTLRDHGPEAEELRRRREPAPHRLRVPEGLDLSVIPSDVLRVYEMATTPPWAADAAPRQGLDGSNNWVIAPSRTATGRPLLANDPHRGIALPALRYLAHLSAPGIDAIGAGEPALPGISIGHNGHVAFGLTIFPIDQEDLYVYRTNPANPHEYWYEDRWEPMTHVGESIPVRDADPVQADLWFTRHGPVIRELPERNAAFAVRAAWLGPGMAPYLGSMDYMRAASPDAFVAAMARWGAPGENQVYASPDGTIGWRPAGRVPVRPGWDGTLPVPGDGRYEWDGFLDVEELPSVRDPAQGWFATANQLNLPPTYPNAEKTVTYDWYAPTRHDRITQELNAHAAWTVEDCVRLQTDYVSLPGRRVQRLLAALVNVEALPPDDVLSGANAPEAPGTDVGDRGPATASDRPTACGGGVGGVGDGVPAGATEGVGGGVGAVAGVTASGRAAACGGGVGGLGDGVAAGASVTGCAPGPGDRLPAALSLLRDWDARLTADSPAAALFEVWYRRHLRPALLARALDGVVGEEQRERALARVLPVEDAAADPRVDMELLDGDPDPELLLGTLTAAVDELAGLLGADPDAWSWGALHHAHPHHAIAALLDGPAPEWASVGPVPRGGSGDTVGAAAYGAGFRQTAGATFRVVVDVGSWDDSVAMNSPGQSGVPGSPHYDDLFASWAADGSFPLLYSREAVEKHTRRTITLRPSAATAQAADPKGR
ncbi:penicillin acylase family protein [Streptomyces sp. BA2]|uniref:penicillin acylase family protein n=1 Tax=Streptomyces sp. BA2 TaxID=436595 RepID=UPI0013252973|nr:penicillin acylase family protein [Streptomyces sp. BA2]MWA09482.1 penicillin acylase family protein [Streptomyces sp. BA2]